jgi:hypothetical protein
MRKTNKKLTKNTNFTCFEGVKNEEKNKKLTKNTEYKKTVFGKRFDHT